MRLPEEIVTLSDRMRKELLAGGLERKNIAVIPNGVDVEGIIGISAGNNRYDVVYVGRLVEHKNLGDLLRALAYASARREIRCCIIGDGPEREPLMKLANELSLNCVDFLGFLDSHEEVVSYLKSAKVFVLPSRREGFCIALLESNASGIPCIVAKHTRNYATDLILEGVNGFVTSAAPEAMGERILAILGNEELMLRLRQTCINYARQFDWNAIALAIEQEYECMWSGAHGCLERSITALEGILA
jgi:glycosyltransferase involved in cell wall biosynthesis